MKYLFPKGNKINLGRKQTKEWKKAHSKRMKGNTYGFQKGNKVNLGRSQTPWNKDKTAKTDSRILIEEKHWNWKDGISRDKHSLGQKKYREWRNEVFIHDNYTCLKCRKKEYIYMLIISITLLNILN